MDNNTGDEINDFYTYLYNDGLSGTSAQWYHSVLHVAFKDAVKRRIIPSNPVDQATRPKREQFIAGYYNVDEIKQLLELTKDDEIYLVILITAYYGLRHSCASLLVAQGVSMKLIQEWLGHSDMATTANIYSHLDAITKADTGAAMSKALG